MKGRKVASNSLDLRARYARTPAREVAPPIETLEASVARLRIETARACDTSTWPGEGVASENYTAPMRRARYKAAKIAAATQALLARQEALLETALQQAEVEPVLTDEELAADIEWAEAEAARLMARAGVTTHSAETVSTPSPGVAAAGDIYPHIQPNISHRKSHE